MKWLKQKTRLSRQSERKCAMAQNKIPKKRTNEREREKKSKEFFNFVHSHQQIPYDTKYYTCKKANAASELNERTSPKKSRIVHFHLSCVLFDPSVGRVERDRKECLNNAKLSCFMFSSRFFRQTENLLSLCRRSCCRYESLPIHSEAHENACIQLSS